MFSLSLVSKNSFLLAWLVKITAVIFYNIFYLEIYWNNIFFKKIIFNFNISKQFKNTLKILIYIYKHFQTTKTENKPNEAFVP
jgi:hypothetical protein